MERKCRECPTFFEVKEEGLIPTGGGWSNKTIDGKATQEAAERKVANHAH